MSMPSAQELEVIKEFKCRMKDSLREEELNDDMFLIRWLRARDLDLNKSEEMLRNALKWREENHMDSILDKKVDPYFSDNFPCWIDGHDRVGRPVMTVPFASWDFRIIARDGKNPKDFLMYIARRFEQVTKAIAESNNLLKTPENPHPVTQFVLLADYKGFPYGQLFNYKAMWNLLQLGSMYEAYYPEIAHSIYYLNSPFFISHVLALLRPVIAPKTMSKIKCLSPGEEWKEEIRAAISPEQIRPQFGGTQGTSEKADDNDNDTQF